MGELAQDELLIQSTQGSNPGPMARVPQFLFTCAPSFLLQKGLPKNVRGVIGLGHAPISVPTRLASHFGFQPKFALCLTSSTRSNGVIFFGDGPYYMHPGIDISRPLIKLYSINREPKRRVLHTSEFNKSRQQTCSTRHISSIVQTTWFRWSNDQYHNSLYNSGALDFHNRYSIFL